MKVSCITIHRPVNFGSALQTLATQIVWEKKGVSLEIIDYIPRRLQFGYRLALLWRDTKIPFSKRIATFLTMDVINRFIFNRFVKKYIHLSRKSYYSLGDLQAEKPQADLYLTGSDQVWNSFYNIGVDPVYYLSFINEKERKVSFAASFGRSELSQSESESIRPYLSEYKLLSVREESATRVIKSMGMSLPECLFDPTLLLSGQEWQTIFPAKPYREKYVLIYPMSYPDPQLFAIARQIADKIRAKVWLLSPGMKIRKDCDKTLLFRSPEDFLSLISQAALVVTNSFHGTAFSLNFHRLFVSLMPYDFGTRITGLLETVGLPDRIYNKNTHIDSYLCPINYEQVERIFAVERQKGNLFIDKTLNLS